MLNKLPDSIAFEYELGKKIGEGSNGETWLVNHKVKKLPAVLKFLKSLNTTDFKTVELFQREAELLKSVHIRGVPGFYSYTTDEQGNGYLIQEYIPYPSLQSLLDQKKIFSEHDALNIALRIAKIIERLQTEYTPAIIHRDIKPSNILYDCQRNSLWLIDFGAVAHPQKRNGGSTIAGTFGYMPPEQMIGEIALQSDYYALGATLLHIITGKFPGNMSSNGYQLDVEGVIKEYAPKTSPAVIQLLVSLLSADIEKRPKTARMLCEAIQKAIDGRQNGFMARVLRRVNECFSADRQKNTRLGSIEKVSGEYVFDELIPVFAHFTEGVVRNVEVFEDLYSQKQYQLFYTFEVRGQTWGGSKVSDDPRFKTFYGSKCRVMYQPFFPGNNSIYSIIPNSKQGV